MVSLNPFKKSGSSKENFPLNSHELPSLSQMNSSGGENSMNSQTGMNTASLGSTLQGDNQAPSSPFPTQNLAQQSSPFDNSQNSSSQSSIGYSQQSHNEMSKAKLDAIDSKVALLETRISNLDNKMDQVLSLLMEEVSDETKAKLKLDSMKNQVWSRHNNE